MEALLQPAGVWDQAPTGIPGLDKLMAGGLPRGSILLLAGNPGTGKTTLAAKIIYEGLRRGEPGLYLSFVEPQRDFLMHMRSLGMDFEQYMQNGLFTYMEALLVNDVEALSAQLEELMKTVAVKGVKRVAVDSVTAMLQLAGDRTRVRELLQNFFVRGLKSLGVVTLLIAEHPYGARTVGYGIEEFIVDAVVILKFSIEEGKVLRTLELRKMRWAPIRQAEVPFYIRPGPVFEVSLPEELSEVPPLDTSRMIDLARVYAVLERAGLLRSTPLTRGRPSSAARLARVPQGGQVFVAVDPQVNSKQLIGLTLAGYLRRYPGEHVAVVTFKSSSLSLKRLTGCVLDAVGCEDTSLALERMHVLSMNPTAFTLNEMYDAARHFVADLSARGLRPGVLVVEGLDLLESLYGDRSGYLNVLYNMLLANKKQRLTTFYVYTAASRSAALSNPLAQVADMGIFVSSTPLGPDAAGRPLTQLINFEVYSSLGHGSIAVTLHTERIAELRCIA